MSLEEFGWNAQWQEKFEANGGEGLVPARVVAERDGPATIEAVLPRASALIRKASGKPDPQLLAANVDVVFIVTAMGGDFNPARLKRYWALVQQSGAAPAFVVNKSDLENNVVSAAAEIEGFGHDMLVHVISARVRESVQVLEQYFTSNRTVALIGSSGVGKSTLTNQLLGRDAQATQKVRDYDGRGQHTTTSRPARPVARRGYYRHAWSKSPGNLGRY